MPPDGASDRDIERAYAGEGPVFERMLAERARQLSRPPEVRAARWQWLVLCRGARNRWMLPAAAVARVEPLTRWTPVPGLAQTLPGLTVLNGRRFLVADLDALGSGTPPMAPGASRQAVLLRAAPVALAVERIEGVEDVDLSPLEPCPPGGTGFNRAVRADGAVLVDVEALLAVVLSGGTPA